VLEWLDNELEFVLAKPFFLGILQKEIKTVAEYRLFYSQLSLSLTVVAVGTYARE
jgi:hypothetical protein